jgi:hypothetical protein
MTSPTNHRWLELTRHVRGEFRQHRHDPAHTLDFHPEANPLRTRLVRPGGDAWITRELTDDELARGDLAGLARDFYQRYRGAQRLKKKPGRSDLAGLPRHTAATTQKRGAAE